MNSGHPVAEGFTLLGSSSAGRTGIEKRWACLKCAFGISIAMVLKVREAHYWGSFGWGLVSMHQSAPMYVHFTS